MRGTIFGEGGEVEYFKLSGENNLLRPINEEYKIGVQSAQVSTWGVCLSPPLPPPKYPSLCGALRIKLIIMRFPHLCPSVSGLV